MQTEDKGELISALRDTEAWGGALTRRVAHYEEQKHFKLTEFNVSKLYNDCLDILQVQCFSE